AVDKNLAKAGFSNTGSHVDLVAPGVSVVSTYISSTTSYVYMDGTSMATPFVSGIAALVKSRYPTWSASTISSRLTSSAQDLGAPGWDSSYGYGLVRADGATA
ncbi:MAG TPA: S8 family serine peptidase, partial [Candidatus Thermoplasmatota archaeon]|nr:S8 family serine peptidase [Candidatus Thermoplasmatota archaeon]